MFCGYKGLIVLNVNVRQTLKNAFKRGGMSFSKISLTMNGYLKQYAFILKGKTYSIALCLYSQLALG